MPRAKRDPRSPRAQRSLGTWLALGSAVSFGTLGLFIRKGYGLGASPMQLVVWRYLLATAVLGSWCLWRRPKPASWRVMGLALLLGMTLSAGEAWAFFVAVNRLGAGLPIVILYTFPVLVSLAHWKWKGHRPGAAEILAMLAALLGTGLVSAVGAVELDKPGLALALSTPLLYGAYVLANEALLKKMEAPLPTGLVLAGSSLSLGLGALALHVDLGLPLPAWWTVVGIGLLGTALPVLGFFSAIERIGAARAAFLSTLEPLVGVALAALFLGESLSPGQWAGAGLVLGALAWLQAKER